jgi:D-glycerate 3-kinase
MEEFPRPSDQLCKDLFEISQPFLKDHAQELKIEGISKNFFQNMIIPLGVYFNLLPKKERPYLICFTGGQGSGKTTLTNFLQFFLRKACERSSISFSIDDIYKTREDRELLAKTVHPLCKVRGVPGTHDVQLGLDTLDGLSLLFPNFWINANQK